MPKRFYQITKNEKDTIRNKTNKNWKKTWNNVLFWLQRLYAEFQARKSENEKKMSENLLREKSHCVVCRSNKSRFLKQKNKLTTNVIKIR